MSVANAHGTVFAHRSVPKITRPAAKLALVVVLPTPPLPEVTTTILAMSPALSTLAAVSVAL